MTKSEFIQTIKSLQDQSWGVFEMLVNEIEAENAAQPTKVVISSELFKDLADSIASEIGGDATGLVDDYELEMYSNEVTISDITLSERKLNHLVAEVLERYFDTKD